MKIFALAFAGFVALFSGSAFAEGWDKGEHKSVQVCTTFVGTLGGSRCAAGAVVSVDTANVETAAQAAPLVKCSVWKCEAVQAIAPDVLLPDVPASQLHYGHDDGAKESSWAGLGAILVPDEDCAANPAATCRVEPPKITAFYHAGELCLKNADTGQTYCPSDMVYGAPTQADIDGPGCHRNADNTTTCTSTMVLVPKD